MYSIKALANDNYIVDVDGSTNQTFDPINLKLPNQSLCFQFKWDSTVSGRFIFEASVYCDTPLWLPLVACEAVEFNTSDYSELNSNIFWKYHEAGT